MEAIRCPRRRLSDVACRQMTNDAKAQGTGPGGHVGTATGSSAAGSSPCTGTSEKSLPGPAANDPAPNPACEPVRSPGRSRRLGQSRTAVVRHTLTKAGTTPS
jgi:hypothetical protein